MGNFTTFWVVKLLIYDFKFFKAPYAGKKKFLCRQKVAWLLCGCALVNESKEKNQ